MLSGTETNLRINFIPGLGGFNLRLALIGSPGTMAREFRREQLLGVNGPHMVLFLIIILK